MKYQYKHRGREFSLEWRVCVLLFPSTINCSNFFFQNSWKSRQDIALRAAIAAQWRMSFDLNHQRNGSSNLTKRKGKDCDKNGHYSNGAGHYDDQMVPKIRVISGGYEPVTVIQEDRSANIHENGNVVAQKDEHKLENGALAEANFENEIVDNVKEQEETSFSIAFEVFIPFLIAGLGTVGAGLLLDKVQV